MTFNIRTLALTDGKDFWSFRKHEVANLIKKYGPDIIGMQEVYTVQARYLEKALPGYEWFGPAREDGKKQGERCPIFYRTDRLELIDHGTFWLSETPDLPGSRSWDAAFPRVVTWGKFRDKKTDIVFCAFNTHFDHMGKTAREKSAEILIGRMKTVAAGLPGVAIGDFNSKDDTDPYSIVTKYLLDSRLISATPPNGPYGTSRNFPTDSKVKSRIDYVFVTRGVTAKDYTVLDDTYGKDRRPSDHMPVLVTVELTDKN